jgi:hypothetical protein
MTKIDPISETFLEHQTMKKYYSSRRNPVSLRYVFYHNNLSHTHKHTHTHVKANHKLKAEVNIATAPKGKAASVL